MTNTISYTAIWTSEQIAQHPVAEDMSEAIFFQPEIQWLRAQGYTGRFGLNYIPYNDMTEFYINFEVSEEDLTWLMLQWPQSHKQFDVA